MYHKTSPRTNTSNTTTNKPNNSMLTASSSHDNDHHDVRIGLYRVLRQANVKFLRFLALDILGNVRSKSVPLAYLQRNPDARVQIATVCFAGLPSHADVLVPETGLSAKGSLNLLPDFSTIRILPYNRSTATVLCDVERRDFCGRTQLRDLLNQHSKYSISIGTEMEFQLLNEATGEPVDDTNFADVQVLDRQATFVDALYDALQSLDIPTELIHSESAPGQLEVVLEHAHPLVLADRLVLARLTVSNVAQQHHLRALFLPKFNEMQAGNGAHWHVSVLKGGLSLISHGEFTKEGASFVEGIVAALPALTALTLSTTNSWRRVGPGCWTGSSISWNVDDKEAPIRALANRIEYKVADATGNPYFGLVGILGAGFDGIRNELTLRAADSTNDQTFPTGICEALDQLEQNDTLRNLLGESFIRSYLALRHVEAARLTSLETEVMEALNRA